MTPTKRLLLISNSVQHGHGYLDHAEAELRSFLGGTKRVLFVPYALLDRDGYAETAQARFERIGCALESIHRAPDPRKAAEKAEAAFIGGGNTFRLLKTLYEHRLLEVIRARVEGGMPYIGSSAGSVVACPTIRTTNDMPIVEPPSLTSLGLIAFQLNCHYFDADPNSTHMGETREVRLREFHEENEMPVVGIREGSMLRVEKGLVVLKGTTGGKVFRRGESPFEIAPGSVVDPFKASGAAL
ncbi:MAG TPA: dipeptidase PepE [Terriglobales bacterium]|jgi:dipeptidase E|nr:dipeptidase PepE [Terriglobales bacterium]